MRLFGKTGAMKQTGKVVGLSGFEPPTSPLSGVCSNHAELQTLEVAPQGLRAGKEREA